MKSKLRFITGLTVGANVKYTVKVKVYGAAFKRHWDAQAYNPSQHSLVVEQSLRKRKVASSILAVGSLFS